MTTISVWIVSIVGLAGLILLGAWLWNLAIEEAVKAIRLKVVICEYIWHRKKFKKWLETNCERNQQ